MTDRHRIEIPPEWHTVGTKKEERKKRRVGLEMYHEMLTPHIEKAKALEPRIKCQKGCAGCCKQPISVVLAEAEYILHKYPCVVEGAIKQIKHHAHVAAQIENEAPGNDQHFADAWWDRQMPCVFLKNNLCTVYEARPLACRNYFVISDPALCDMREKKQVLMLLPVNPQKQTEIVMQLQPVSGCTGGWFAEMLVHAWENRK